MVGSKCYGTVMVFFGLCTVSAKYLYMISIFSNFLYTWMCFLRKTFHTKTSNIPPIIQSAFKKWKHPLKLLRRRSLILALHTKSILLLQIKLLEVFKTLIVMPCWMKYNCVCWILPKSDYSVPSVMNANNAIINSNIFKADCFANCFARYFFKSSTKPIPLFNFRIQCALGDVQTKFFKVAQKFEFLEFKNSSTSDNIPHFILKKNIWVIPLYCHPTWAIIK